MYGQPGYYPSPTVQTAQQRLQMLEAQYPQFAGSPGVGYPQPAVYTAAPQQAPSASPTIKGRPVSNEEEANAALIDFDGSLFVFLDKAHGKIYTKQLGLDGNIIFQKYSLEEGPPPAPQSSETYVKQAELDRRLEELNNKLSSLEQRFSSNKGGNKV